MSASQGPSAKRLGELLVQFGIVQRDAVEDPEGFDNYRTVEMIAQLALELRVDQSIGQP